MKLGVSFTESNKVFAAELLRGDETLPADFGEFQVVSVGGVKYTAGDNISISDDGEISVLTADAVEEDNTRPVTSAAVATQVGNIEILLKTI